MIRLTITIDTESYRQHVEAAEATDDEIVEKLQQDIGEAIQTYRHYPVIVDAIRQPRQDFGLTIPVHDTWADLPDEKEMNNGNAPTLLDQYKSRQ